MSALLKVRTALAPMRVFPQLKVRAKSDEDRTSSNAPLRRTLADDVALGMMVACSACFAAALVIYGLIPAFRSLGL